MKRNLTLRYSLYQLLYFAIAAVTGGFAVTFLLSKGFSSAQIGLILAVTNIPPACFSRCWEQRLIALKALCYRSCWGCWAVNCLFLL